MLAGHCHAAARLGGTLFQGALDIKKDMGDEWGKKGADLVAEASTPRHPDRAIHGALAFFRARRGRGPPYLPCVISSADHAHPGTLCQENYVVVVDCAQKSTGDRRCHGDEGVQYANE